MSFSIVVLHSMHVTDTPICTDHCTDYLCCLVQFFYSFYKRISVKRNKYVKCAKTRLRRSTAYDTRALSKILKPLHNCAGLIKLTFKCSYTYIYVVHCGSSTAVIEKKCIKEEGTFLCGRQF